MTSNYIYVSDITFNITKKHNSIQISIFNNDKISKQEMNTYSFSGENMQKTNKKFEVLNISKLIFIRQNIKRNYTNYYSINNIYEFKGFRDEKNAKKNKTISCYTQYNEAESIKNLEKLIKDLRNYDKDYTSYFKFSDNIIFIDREDYYFSFKVPFMDDSSFYHIIIEKTNSNKHKIIKFFETYLKLILSINPTYIPNNISNFSSIKS